MKTFGARAYPDDWDSSCLWDGKLSVHFGYPSDGWVLLSLLSTAYNGSLVIHMSDIGDPFGDLVEWLKAVAENRLPASFRIDEEGVSKELTVSPYNGIFSKSSDVEFRVNGDSWNEETKETEEACYFLMRARRGQLLEEFVTRLEHWLEHDYDPNGWIDSAMDEASDNPLPDLRKLDIAGLKEAIKSNKELD